MSDSQVAANLALVTKLHEVADAIAFIEKRGHNAHHGYDFVQAVDVVRKVRDELLQRKVIVLPGASQARHLAYGSGSHLTTVDLSYRFTDIETGAVVEVPWVGLGADKGGDKGLYKAFTGGLKTMLMTTFLIPSTSDPERDQLTEQTTSPVENGGGHKDDARPAAPAIPRDRAVSILKAAEKVGMATIDLDAAPGTPPEFHPAFNAVLALQGVAKITQLNVDQAEAVEAWLHNEATAA